MNFKKIRWSSLVWQTVLIFALFQRYSLLHKDPLSLDKRIFCEGNINNKNFTWKDESEK